MSLSNNQYLRNLLLKNFNHDKIKFIYGYGSGVFPQKDNKAKMIDLIFIVENTLNFHNENIIINKNHYSKFAIYFRPLLYFFNEKGTKIYYNPSVVLENQINIKYGIISEKNFLQSLNKWNNLFVSGRFHKPVICIYNKNNEIEILENSINSI